MKMMKKLIALLMVAALMQGCGGGEPQIDDGPQVEVNDPVENDEVEVKPDVTVNVAKAYTPQFVMDLPGNFIWDDAWSCYYDQNSQVRIWCYDMDMYEFDHNFNDVLENQTPSEVEEITLDSYKGYKSVESEGFYGPTTHYYVDFNGRFEEYYGCHMIVSIDEGDISKTQDATIINALNTIRKEGMPLVDLNPKQIMDTLKLNFTSEDTVKMSNFMNGGYYGVKDNEVYGYALDSQGYAELVHLILEDDGDFVKVKESEILKKESIPSYVNYYNDEVYYIDNYERINKINVGGEISTVVEGASEYLQIRNDKMYYCDPNYHFVRSDMDGSNPVTILDKEVYYAYLLNDEWMIYQDDADNERLHLYNITHGLDVALSDGPAYCPVIYGNYIYYPTYLAETSALVRQDISKPEVVYDEESKELSVTFASEYGDNNVSSTIAISEDGFIYNQVQEGYYVDEWKRVNNLDDQLERNYVYIGKDYEFVWEYNDVQQITNIYLYSNIRGGGQSIPRFD